jgi:hypothetical protein
MNNQWQDNLRNRMEHHEEPVPEGLWESVEQVMSAGSSVGTKPAGQRIRLWDKRIGAVAAVGIVLFFIGLYTLKENQKDIQLVEQRQPELPAPVAHPDKEPLLAHRTENEKPETEKKLRGAKGEETAKTAETVRTADVVEAAERQSEEIPRQGEPENSPSPRVDRKYSPETNDGQAFRLPARRRNGRPAKWQTDLYASNIPSGSSKHYDGYRSFTPFGLKSEEEEHVLAAGSGLPGDFIVGKEYRHVYTDVKHFQPVTLGVSLKYNLSDSWSITSGLNYTVLSSQLSTGSYNHYYNSRQTLHYLGLPVTVNYTVWRSGQLSTYISGGGMVEKNVAGALSTDYIVDNKIEERSQEGLSVKPLQWSVSSAAGMEYRLWKGIGLYAEPGVTYHFRNSSGVETIYREKPLNFNIRLGLRFSFNE